MKKQKQNSNLKLVTAVVTTFLVCCLLFFLLFEKFEFRLEASKKPVSLLGNYLTTHTLRLHVDKSPRWLEERLKHREFIRFVSTFYNIEIAEDSIQATIDENSARIEYWVKDQTVTKNMRKSFHKHFADPIGFGLSRKSPKALELYDVKVVIQKINNYSYKIIQSYPVPRKKTY